MEITRLHDEIRNVQGQISVIENKTQEKIVNLKQAIDDSFNKIHTKMDNLYANLTDIVKQEINAKYSKINIQADNLYTNPSELMNQAINNTSNKINIKPDNVSTKPTQIMT